MRKLTKIFVIFYTVFNVCSCANILIVDSIASPSHQIFNYAIAEILLERGHNITFLGSSSPIKRPVHENHTHIELEDLHERIMGEFKEFPDTEKMTLPEVVATFLQYCELSCIFGYDSKGTRTLLNYPKDFKFDAIVLDLTTDTCFLHLIQRFNYPPTVAMTAFLLPHYLATKMGTPIQPGYIPVFHTKYTDEMTFYERLLNYFAYHYENYLSAKTSKKAIQEMAVKTFGENIDSVEDLEKHLSILLSNWNPAMHYPQPISPNIIPIAGAHIKLKPIPKDIQDILDNAKNGLVLFSLGTNMKSADLTPEARKNILEALSKVKATILWKFEEELTGLPENVIIRKWIPQQNVLAHPNTKLFISHGGGLSTIEATYFGVPVLGMPFFGDQHNNMDLLIQKKVARKVVYGKLTSEDFLANINEMLNNPMYHKEMKELSSRFRDQPDTPRERVAFWIEYVIRHNGSLFLSPKSRYLSGIVASSTDIHLFLMFVTSVIIFVLYKVKNFVFSSNDNRKKQKTN